MVYYSIDGDKRKFATIDQARKVAFKTILDNWWDIVDAGGIGIAVYKHSDLKKEKMGTVMMLDDHLCVWKPAKARHPTHIVTNGSIRRM